jgi:hypothetical protein
MKCAALGWAGCTELMHSTTPQQYLEYDIHVLSSTALSALYYGGIDR